MRHAVYCATRNLYADMETAAKSLVANSDVDVVHFVIEDAEFPHPLPDIVQCHDVSGQALFPKDGPNYLKRWTWMVLMRAALHRVLPDVDRVLSLDCDTICTGDMTPAWDLDIDNCYFAGVPERWALDRPGLFYCNVGVAFWNLDLLRETGKGDEIIDVLNVHEFAWPDQDAANYLCQGFIGRMPTGFNSCPFVIQDGTPQRLVHYAARNDWRNEAEVRYYRTMSWAEAMRR